MRIPRKKSAWILIIFFIIIFAVLPVEAAQTEDSGQAGETPSSEEILEQGVQDVLSGLDLSGLQQFYEEHSEAFGGKSLEEAIQAITENGFSEITAEQVLNAALETLKNALFGSWWQIAQIIIMLLLMGLIGNLKSSFDDAGVSRAAFWAGYLIVATLAVSLLASCIVTAKDAIETLASIVDVITPILIALLTGMGGLSSSGVLSPVMAGLTGGIFTVVKTVVFPLILVSTVISLASHLSSTIKLTRLSALIDSVVKWFLGIVMTLFIGVTAIKGVAGAAIDGVSFKTAKFTVDKMVPVIGGMFSDTLDTIMACSVIVKNAVGLVGLVLLAAALAAPLATLMANMFLFRIAAAVAEPFAEERFVKLLSAMSSTVMLLFATLLTCIVMAFILITILMGTADIALMMR